jgi:exopolyphosphatase/guanosine-5'-triphosphate,3'-diphosphate pyrophosphatase
MREQKQKTQADKNTKSDKDTKNTKTGKKSADEKPHLAAVIDIGSAAIRMIVAEVSKKGGWKLMDRAVKPAPLGRDVFMSGYISREAAFLSLRIFAGFVELLAGWNIEKEDVKVIATSAVREAKNRDTFIDQVFLRTGLKVHVLEGIEENHLAYLAVQHAARDMRADMARSSSLILEVGGGSTEIMLLKRGKVIAAYSLPLGTIRMEKYILDAGNSGHMEAYIRENIQNFQETLDTHQKLSRIKYFVVVSSAARLAAEKIGAKIKERYSLIAKKDFLDFIAGIRAYSVDECVKALRISYHEAEGLVPSLLVCKQFLEETGAEKLLIPDVSLQEGALLSSTLGSSLTGEEQFFSQVIASALGLGRKFHFDEERARRLSKIALLLFDQLAEEHGLDAHGRLLLEASAILHGIGAYIDAARYEKHSYYIISNSELFGFSRSDIKSIAFIVRLHTRASAQVFPGGFASLRREERLRVLKLAAILRLADGLARDPNQKPLGLRLEKRGDEMLLTQNPSGGRAGKNSPRLQSEMFEEVFGYRMRLA